MHSIVLEIPIFSILSSVFLIPAVSIKRNNFPLRLNVSSITSLVVPAIGLVIAFSSFNIEFNKDDLPTLGAPTIETGIPSFNEFPYLKESIN